MSGLPVNLRNMGDSEAFGEARSAAPLSLPITTNRSPENAPEPDLEKSGEGCPNTRGMIFVNLETGVIVPARCRRNSCAYCVRGNARQRARAIALAKPDRAILLTQAGDSWQLVRSRMYRAKYELQKELGKSFEWVYHVEPNPKGTGHHVHAWERGAFIPQEMLSRVADGAGFGPFARINKIRSVEDAANYGLKGLGYGLKGVAAVESRSAYLIANGKRLTHQSRGFFVDSEGQSVGVRDAERAAARHGQEETGTWQLMAGTV